MLEKNWIYNPGLSTDIPSVFKKRFVLSDGVRVASLRITSLGAYEAVMNGQRVGEFYLAPGWTDYKRTQMQEYDVTGLLKKGENELTVTVGGGWYHNPFLFSIYHERIATIRIGTGIGKPCLQDFYINNPNAVTLLLKIETQDGRVTEIITDETWETGTGPVLFSGIYDGEIYDARLTDTFTGNAKKLENAGAPVIPDLGDSEEAKAAFRNALKYEKEFETDWTIRDFSPIRIVPQEGEEIRVLDSLPAQKIFRTPKGELIVDFGQEVTGSVIYQGKANAGDIVDLSFSEVFDKDGNFYNENYRSAKCQYHYICKDGENEYTSHFTFYGFRYIRVNEFPGGTDNVKPENFRATLISSNLRRTGKVETSNPLLNRLIENIFWGQIDNYLDVPTDCPQRDERLGWTGDTQVFARAGAFNYHTLKFFRKWLSDLALGQAEDGAVDMAIPAVRGRHYASSAWSDAATIVPWQMYLMYNDKDLLRRQFPSMKKWVEYIRHNSTKENLWTGDHKKSDYGDWLGLDAPTGTYKGSTREDFIASAFFAYSTELLVKAGHVIGEDVSEYEKLYDNIVKAFRKEFPTYLTQTEKVLALYFKLAENEKETAEDLIRSVEEKGHLETGFVGTPYLLHVLSEYGATELAYKLLLREEYPGWLYSVTKGATTIWEHWDGIMEDGSFWSSDMNSFNHYAYGAVIDWIYMVAGGIQVQEDGPGFTKIKIAPQPSKQLPMLNVEFESPVGKIISRWEIQGDCVNYEITVPSEAEIQIDGKTEKVSKGKHSYRGKI